MSNLEFIKGEVQAYCMMVKNGKPAASLAVQERYIDEIITIVKSRQLNSYVECLAEGWKTLWIYKYHHVLEIIRGLPQVPESIVDHWLLGKLYGYDEESIADFLKSKFS